MSTPFSRTMRSLQADRMAYTLFWLVLALIILGMWSAWFFFAKVALYETSETVRVVDRETVEADFPPDVMNRIRLGLPASIVLHDASGLETQPLDALVTKMVNPKSQRVSTVTFFIIQNLYMPESLEGLSGQVTIAVENVSPAMLVMRATGLFVDSPKVKLSPTPTLQPKSNRGTN